MNDRAEGMIRLLEQGYTMTEVGQFVGLTRERVRQIVRAVGYTGKATHVRRMLSITAMMTTVRDSRVHSFVEVSKRTGIEYRRIVRTMKELGIYPAVRRLFRMRGGRPGKRGYDWPHGFVQRYRRGCRCDLCRAANTEYFREQRERKRNSENN